MSSFLVLMLVFSPVELPAPVHVCEPCWRSLKDLATILEISGPTCLWYDNFRQEIRWMRTRWRTIRDCPPLSDCNKLPNRQVCLENLSRVTAQEAWLLRASAERLHWQERLEKPLKDVRKCIKFWEAATQSLNESQNWGCRRESLKEIRTLIGTKDYDENLYQISHWPYIPLVQE